MAGNAVNTKHNGVNPANEGDCCVAKVVKTG